MKVTRHDDFLYVITKLSMINCYLVVEDDGVTLIDTLTRGAGRAILEVIKQTDRPLKRVMITHAHTDHAGSTDEILSANPNVEFLVQERSVPILSGDLSLQRGEPRGRILKMAYRDVRSPITRTFEDGDRIGSLLAIATPGHTTGHFAFFDERNRTLIAGDCWQTLGGLAVAGDTRWRFPMPTWGTWHRPTNLASARKTLGLTPTHLAVGHGRILRDAYRPMQMAVERAARKIG